MSSLQTMGNLIGRKRQRAKSAIGYVIVSHTDRDGVERLSNYGSTFFDLDESSDYDNIDQEESANYIKKSALVPWTSPSVYEVPKGTIFTAANGTQFISTKTVKTRILSTPWSSIKNNYNIKEDITSPFEVKEIRDKSDETNIKHWGFSCCLKNKKIQEKIEKTLFKK